MGTFRKKGNPYLFDALICRDQRDPAPADAGNEENGRGGDRRRARPRQQDELREDTRRAAKSKYYGLRAPDTRPHGRRLPAQPAEGRRCDHPVDRGYGRAKPSRSKKPKPRPKPSATSSAATATCYRISRRTPRPTTPARSFSPPMREFSSGPRTPSRRILSRSKVPEVQSPGSPKSQIVPEVPSPKSFAIVFQKS